MQTIDGISFDVEPCCFAIPHFEDASKAVYILKKYMAELSWMWLTALTNNRVTLPQVQTILAGQSVGGISIAELTAVKRYCDAMKWLFVRLKARCFRGDMTDARELNRLLCGRAENQIQFSRWELQRLQQAETLLTELTVLVSDPCKRALIVFLALTRAKVFDHANTRTASLMMNGILITHGFWPIAVTNRRVDEFRKLLLDFMCTGRADEMLSFFAKSSSNLYPTNETRNNASFSADSLGLMSY